MNAARIAKKVLFVIALFIVSLAIKYIILDGVGVTRLQTGPPLAGSIAPSLAPANSKSIPVVGENFKILSTRYFDDKQWAVASVASLPDMDLAILVLEKIDGVYTVVLGPGTSFPSSAAQSMPADVAVYLQSRGLI